MQTCPGGGGQMVLPSAANDASAYEQCSPGRKREGIFPQFYECRHFWDLASPVSHTPPPVAFFEDQGSGRDPPKGGILPTPLGCFPAVPPRGPKGPKKKVKNHTEKERRGGGPAGIPFFSPLPLMELTLPLLPVIDPMCPQTPDLAQLQGFMVCLLCSLARKY